MEVNRSLDARPIKTEPHPKHPLANCDRFVCAVAEPNHGEQESSKTPYGKHSEDGEVAHHFTKRYEEHILRHEIECQSRDKNGRAHGENVHSLLARYKLALS